MTNILQPRKGMTSLARNIEHKVRAFPFPGEAGRGSSGWRPLCLEYFFYESNRAKYQRNKFVMAEADRLHITLLFLPTYSPNLNLIERLWKFVKTECLYSPHYDQFSDFTTAIETCLKETTGEHKKKLSTLLTLKFQLFDSAA